MSNRERTEALGEALRASEAEVVTSRLGRLWRTGTSAARMTRALLLRDAADGVDVEKLARMVTSVGELKGVAMKAGQLLGYIDPTLDAEVRAHFAVLHTSSPASPFGRVEEALREAFGGRADELLATLVHEPMAVASIGQVHRARLSDGVEACVKVRHHGIVTALENDFRAAGAGSAFARLLVPRAGASVREAIDEVRTAMLEECDYALEAGRQETFARLFAADERVLVPAVIRPWCAEGVLTTRFVPGESIDAFDARHPSQRERDQLGAALFDFYVGTLYRHGLFHADPHPGNLAVRDGRLVVYDYGCVRRFDRATVEALSGLASAVIRDDEAAMASCFVALGAAPPDAAARAALRPLLRGFFAPMLTRGRRRVDVRVGFEGRQVLRDKQTLMNLQLPGKLLFLFRLRFGLYAVLQRIGAELDWAELELAARPRPAVSAFALDG